MRLEKRRAKVREGSEYEWIQIPAKAWEIGFAFQRRVRSQRSGENIDLDAALVALRRGLEVYQHQLDEMRQFQQTWNADVGDRQGDVATKAAEMRRGIELVAAIRAKGR